MTFCPHPSTKKAPVKSFDHFHHRMFDHRGRLTDLEFAPDLEHPGSRALRYGSPVSWSLTPIIDLYGITGDPDHHSPNLPETIWLQIVTKREGAYLLGGLGFVRAEDEAIYRAWLARRTAVETFLAETA